MFTWSEWKNRENRKKHGLYLSEITDVFTDPHGLDRYDREHSTQEEERYIFIGHWQGMILYVVTADEADGDIRIINARKAEPYEEEAYYDHYQKEISGN
jgi:uncharacterized DUF497 family protein